ncbi:MAG TPA: FAD-dependent oxidoreductase [Alphaproteobacteria bacterium]|jgi:3-phenylpropionate/trans-cinnamate dioxygenase ferredoxin reductase subunit|nr:FAD-dependent oxidoreductase [Alphaproteobacteria bacterium]
MSETIIVIGAGHAGAQIVESLRSGGFDGKLIMIGDEAYRPYDRPSTSKELLSGGIELDRIFLKREQFYADKAIDLRLDTTATAIDAAKRTVTLSTGEALSYDKLVIATGARARRLQVPGADLDGVFYLRSLADSHAIGARLGPGKRLAIVGGGYVGLEVAASATKLGCKVTVIEALERLLARVAGAEVADFYVAAHRAAGVDFHFGVVIERFVGEGSVKAVQLTDGTEIPADAVVVGIGAIPNTELAAAAGLAVENGIVVDDCGRTTDPAIFAVGDATNHPNDLLGKRLRLESVPAAMGQARAAASAILGTPKPFHEIPWFWSDQYDIKLQIVGISEIGDQVVLRGDPAERRFAAFYLRKGKVVAVNAVNSGKDFIQGKKLVAEGRVPDVAKLADPAVPLAEV